MSYIFILISRCSSSEFSVTSDCVLNGSCFKNYFSYLENFKQPLHNWHTDQNVLIRKGRPGFQSPLSHEPFWVMNDGPIVHSQPNNLLHWVIIVRKKEEGCTMWTSLSSLEKGKDTNVIILIRNLQLCVSPSSQCNSSKDEIGTSTGEAEDFKFSRECAFALVFAWVFTIAFILQKKIAYAVTDATIEHQFVWFNQSSHLTSCSLLESPGRWWDRPKPLSD